jgi:hypothetical protein
MDKIRVYISTVGDIEAKTEDQYDIIIFVLYAWT